MRIIHTGDWHMNHRLGRKDLTEDINQAIEQIATYADTCKADVLIVAGDLFQGRESRDQLRASLRFLKKTFEMFVQRGGTIVAISGNHDNENFFLTLQDAFDMVSPVQEKDGVHPAGRLYIAPKPGTLKLRGKDEQIVQFVLMPYPIPTAFLPADSPTANDPDERIKLMTDTYRNTLNDAVAKLDVRYPAVLVCHVAVNGTAISDIFRPNSREVMLEVSDLPTHFAYGAFGHIHRPGPVSAGLDRFRYCGSLLPLDAGEAGQSKSVTFVEIGQSGVMGSPEVLPIAGRHLRKILISADETDVLTKIRAGETENLQDIQKYTRCSKDCMDDECYKTTLVHYTLQYNPSKCPDPYPLHKKIQSFFFNWYGNDIKSVNATGQPEDENGGGKPPPPDITEAVLQYLQDQALFTERDADKQQVVDLARRLLNSDCLMQNVHNSELTPTQMTSNTDFTTELMSVRIEEVKA